MTFKIRIEKAALKYMKRQSTVNIKRLQDAIDHLKENPRAGAPLTKHEAQFKYRIGDFRILYDLYNDELIIVVVKIYPKGDVYKK